MAPKQVRMGLMTSRGLPNVGQVAYDRLEDDMGPSKVLKNRWAIVRPSLEMRTE